MTKEGNGIKPELNEKVKNWRISHLHLFTEIWKKEKGIFVNFDM